MDGTPPYPQEGADDLWAALDFSEAGGDRGESALDAFDGYVPSDETGDTPYEEDDELQSSLFTITNPPGTVTVSAYLDGRVQRVDLTAKVTHMTEPHLAEEILVIADLARQRARSAQYAFISEAMRELGQDHATTRDFLGREMDLPSPDEAIAATAQVFAARYGSDHD